MACAPLGGIVYFDNSVFCQGKFMPQVKENRLTFPRKDFYNEKENHNFIEDQVPSLRRRVKENRVKVPGDPVTVNGQSFAQCHCRTGEKAHLDA